MNAIIRPLLFIGIFLTIFAGLHWYVYFRLSHLFPKTSFGYTLILLGWITFSAMLISRSYYNQFIRAYYTAGSIWLGILFLLFSSFILYEILHKILPISQTVWQVIIPTVILTMTIFGLINGQLIAEKHIEIPLKNLKEPLKVIQLSDLHVGTIHNEDYFHDIVTRVNKQNPDIVFITGDMFDGSGLVDGHVIEPLNEIKAKTYFVMGNHEVYESIPTVEKVMNKTTVNILRNSAVEYKGVQIIGMDDPESHHSLHGPNLSKIKIAQDKPTILLYHQPTGLRKSAEAGIDLQLSGHTHNGQMFPFTLLVKLIYPYIKGLYYIGDMALYVSPGTGTWGPPMRIGSQNEITIINLVKD